jgi:hypothetical protein
MKINEKTFRNLRKQKKTRKEIAEHFNCTVRAVQDAVKRFGLQRVTKKQFKGKVNAYLQTKIFNEVNVHATTAQGMINELSIAISDNVAIKQSIKQKISEAKNAKVVKDEIKRFFEAQDYVIQRMKDYRELQKDLIGIAELQKFVYAIVDAYGTLPLEYRIRFQNELKKRDIVHLDIEQLVDTGERSIGDHQDNAQSGNVAEGNRDISKAAEVSTDAITQ